MDHSYAADCVRRDGYFEVIPRHQRLRGKKPLETQNLHKLWDELASSSATRARLAAQTPKYRLGSRRYRLR